ncbi:SDR family NAD(P)-dependent oxidoreductase [Nocardiopsis sp. CNT-189]|uniref:SDR family NAD(P)-dependent oxidoreductase n=1 Tax=Nocardiopsis oceanisediminis TaxID=2816862 RepID=UPI003B3B61BC
MEDRQEDQRPATAPAGSPGGEAGGIAVIGLACRFPGAPDPAALWELLRGGGEAVHDTPADRWSAEDLYSPDPDAPGRVPTRRGAFLDAVDRFDAAFFGISPREAAAMDPQQRLVLELGWEALEHAGVPPASRRGTGVGVFIGAIWDDYASLLRHEGAEEFDRHTLTGTHRGMIANRLSYALGLRGPSLVIDSGQSSSLVAVDAACQSLIRGEAGLALAGGVNLNIVPESAVAEARFGALSPDGRCYAFDARANGYVRGEGGGLVLLKPLARAREDGDRILAVIRGSAVNSGGAEKGMTVPDTDAQAEVLRAAYERAGVDPAHVGHVELHGTGTPVGDPIEAAALGAVLGGSRRDGGRPLPVGSVKTNIGHLEGAAGIAGLIKTVLALHHRELPPSLNFATPNPDIPLDELRLRVVTEREPLEAPPGGAVRTAGVSSFGMGGTNCHVVLSEEPGGAPARAGAAESGPRTALPAVPWLVSGKSTDARDAQVERLGNFLAERPGLDPMDVGFSLATGRSVFEHRAMSVQGEEWVRGSVAGTGKTVFVFPGQGSQWLGMGAELLDSSPAFAEAIAECEAAFSGLIDWSLTDVLRGAEGAASLDRVDVVQPALFATMIGLAEVWRSLGVEPDAVLGHSQGEIAAAHVAGALSLKDAARVVILRSQALKALAGSGGMVSIAAPADDVEELIGSRTGLSIAVVNGPSATVVSGDAHLLDGLIAECEETGLRARRVPVDYASHSAHVERIETELHDVLAGISPQRSAVAYYSATENAWIEDTTVLGPDYWYRNLREPVLFGPSVETLKNEGHLFFIETSPHPVLLMALPDEVIGTGTLRRDEGGLHRLLLSAGEAWTNGLNLDWANLFNATGAKTVDLPTYAFQRRRHWFTDALPDTADVPADAGGSLLAERLAGLSGDEKSRRVLDLVLSQAATVLGYASTDEIDTDSTFRDLGCTSLAGVELRNRIAASAGLRLPSSLVFDHPTPNALTAHLLEEIEGEGSAPRTPRAPRVNALKGAAAAPLRDDEPIAITGMACRLPGGVESPEDLWRLVASGGDAIAEFPGDRGWAIESLYDPDPERTGTSSVRHGGFLDDAAGFDAAFFGISPREALAMDPQQRLMLETSWEALERAGIPPTSLSGAQVGVFTGAMAQDYGPRLQDAVDASAGRLLTGTTTSVLSGRVAYTLGLEGPALTVDTACSSSLVALHLAVQALRRGECDMALAGGVAVMATPGMFIEFSRQRGLAPDGRSKAFAAGADGTSWAEGAGVLLVERLSDARRSGRRVLAVVRGSAINQDGASNGLTAPNGPSQQRVIRAALADARLEPADVDAVEAHGTGTRLGDPIEAQALLATYGRNRGDAAPLRLGSLKSNIGHAQAAAGVAGLIKMVMALRGGVLPKTLHVDEPTPEVDWDAGAVELLTDDLPWPEEAGRARRFGVSSFGISGTNAHVIVEEDTEGAPEDRRPLPKALPAAPWILSAKSDEAVEEQIGRLTDLLDERADLDPVDVGFSLATGRSVFEHRAMSVQGQEWVRGSVAGRGRTVFVFPGQGSQWLGMGAELLDSSPVFAQAVNECEAAFAGLVDWSLTAVLRGTEGSASLDRVDVVQPALFATMIGLAEVWRSLGVEPDAVLGHSQGEIAAACVAGALSLEDAARVVILRSQALKALAGSGGMVSIAAPEERVAQIIEGRDGLSIAVVNGPDATVVSGDADLLDGLIAECEETGLRARRVPVDYASHSAHVERIETELRDVLAGIRPRRADLPFFSSLEGAWVEDTSALNADYWYRNLRHPVLFGPSVETLKNEGHLFFIETSPHPVLLMALPDDTVGTGTLRRDEGGLHRLLLSAGEAWTNGLTIDWASLFNATGAKTVDLPTYAFQRERYWLAPPPRPSLSGGGDAAPGAERTSAGSPLDDWGYRVTWTRSSPAARIPRTRLQGRWLLVVPSALSGPGGSAGGGPATGGSDAGAPGALRGAAADIDRAVRGAGGSTSVAAVGPGDGRTAIADAVRAAALAEGPDGAGAFSGVVSLFGASPDGAGSASGEAPPVPGAALTSTVLLIQALRDAGVAAPLWCVTRGAVSTGRADAPPSPEQAMLWGLGRVAALEHPGSWGGLLDLPAAAGPAAGSAASEAAAPGSEGAPDRASERASDRAVAAVLGGAYGDEDQVAVRPSGVLVRRLARAPLADRSPVRSWSPEGTVLVTGAFGALGGHLARWVASRGARRIVLAGRRGAETPGAAGLVAELEASGAQVTAVACDVGDRDRVAELIGGLRDGADGTRLTAVVHAAAQLDDGLVESLRPEQVARALRAKAAGARHLDELTRDLDLDAFVLFSSVSATLGLPGQGNYAPGNAFLDALAEERRAAGRHALSIAWGPWAGGGMAAEGSVGERLRRHGLPSMDPRSALEVLDRATACDETVLTVADIEWDRFFYAYTVDRARPLVQDLPEVRRLREREAPAPEGAAAAPAAPLARRAAGAGPEERDRALLEAVRGEVAGVLGFSGPSEVRPDRPFKEIGFDSITGVELRNRLNTATGLRLPATAVFDHPTPAELAARIGAELFGGGPEAGAASAAAGAGGGAGDDPIAIVAMACRYPGGVRGPEELWELLARGGDATSGLPRDRGWDLESLVDPDPASSGTTYADRGGFLHDAAEFDPAFFGISPREALAMDPQQRLLLEASWEAFERAGIVPESLRGSRTGVFVGLSYQDYAARIPRAPEEVEGYLLTGSTPSVASGRIAYTFGLEGPAATIDTACSSSLVALHQAVRALRGGECDMALAGGVAVMSTPAMLVDFSRQRALAPDGRCKAFAAGADGFGPGEGLGLLLVERLSDARRNGHEVLALVRGTAVNQDGASNGLTAPNGSAQQRVIRAALDDAGLAPGDVDAVEAHGTGTALGDPIEAGALQAVYGRGRPEGRALAVGSVKSNIGHAQAAAGVAGVIKMVEAMRRGPLPRTLHAEEPSRHIDWDSGGLALLSEPAPWPETGRPRRSAVSSFGISGTNAHVVLEQGPAGPAAGEGAGAPEDADARPLPLVLSARSPEALRGQAAALRDHLDRAAAGEAAGERGGGAPSPAPRLLDLARTLAAERTAFPHRAALLPGGGADARGLLDVLASGGTAPGLHLGTAQEGATAFLFSGQGSQRAGMGRGLHRRFPVFARALDEVCARFDAHLDLPLRDVMFAEEGTPEAAELHRTRYTQCALFALETALYRLAESWGLRADVLIGHSIGELAAAHVSGVLGLDDACTLVAARGRLMQGLPEGGAMLAVQASEEEAAPYLEGREAALGIAAVNGPSAVVLSGDEEAVAEAERYWSGERGRKARRLRVGRAFHSPRMEPVLAEFRAVAERLDYRPPRIPVVSNLTGRTASAEELADPGYWVRHIRHAVRFLDGVRELAARGVTAYLELGPDGVLTAMARDCLDGAAEGPSGSGGGPLLLPALRRGRDEAETASALPAAAHVHGAGPDWEVFFSGSGARRADLPTYAFQRRRLWLDAPDRGAAGPGAEGLGLQEVDHPLLRAALPLPDGEGAVLTGRLSLRAQPWLADHAVAGGALLPGTAFGELAVRAAEQAGGGTVRELTLEAPLPLAEGEGTALHVAVSAAGADGSRSVSVHARPSDAGPGEPWTRHASGTIAGGPVPGSASPAPAGPDGSAAWPPPGARPVPLDGLYEGFAGTGLEFGPSFQGLRAVWRGDGAVFAEVALAEEAHADAARCAVHPALLDSALHAIAAGGLGPGDGGVRLPFVWSGLTVHAPGAVRARVRIEPLGDDAVSVLLSDDRGRPVAEVERLTLRRAAPESLGRPARGGLLYRVSWEPVAAPPSGGAADAPVTVVAGPPEDAVAAPPTAAAPESGGRPEEERRPAEAPAQDGGAAAGGPAGRNGATGAPPESGLRPEAGPRATGAPAQDGGADRAGAPAGGAGVRGALTAGGIAAALEGRRPGVRLQGGADGGAAPEGTAVVPLPGGDDVHGAVRAALGLVQWWIGADGGGAGRLVLVAQGAVAAEGDPAPSPPAAAAWALIRSAQTENPGRFGLVDVDGDPASLRALPDAVASDEPQLAVRRGGVLAARLAPAEAGGADGRADTGAGPANDSADRPEPSVFRPGGTVLITGAGGTLARVLALHLAREHGVRRLLLLGRRGPDAPGTGGLTAELAAEGAEVRVAACDAADRDALARAIAEIPAEHPLSAVVHAAGVVDDGIAAALDPERLAPVLRPKADAARHLDELTRGLGLDAFVLFSSAAGVFGTAGQASYAAANAAMDALARRRAEAGHPALSLAWGMWAERSAMTGGLGAADLKRMRRSGIGALETGEGLALFDAALRGGGPVLLPMRIDAAGLRREAASGAEVPALLRNLVRAAPPRRSPAPAGSAVDGDGGGAPSAPRLLELLRGADDRRRVLLEAVCAEAAGVLGHPSSAAIDPDEGFVDAGFDSLTAVELRNRLGAAAGTKLPATLVFDYPTPAALAGFLDEELPHGDGEPAGAAPGSGGRPATPGEAIAELDRMASALAAPEAPVGHEDRTALAKRLRNLVALVEDPAWGSVRRDADPGGGAATGPGGPAGGADAGGTDISTASADELFDLLDGELSEP